MARAGGRPGGAVIPPDAAGGSASGDRPYESRALKHSARAMYSVPMPPPCRKAIASRTLVDERLFSPTCMCRACLRAASIMRRPSQMLCDAGFST